MEEKKIDWRFPKALHLCDYNHEKALELLELIDMSMNKSVKLPEEDPVGDWSCRWCFGVNECWVDMPDSKYVCKGRCDRYEGIKKDHD